MVTCSGCGAASSDTVRFCPSCGRALASLDTPTLEPDEISVVPKPAPSPSHPPQSGGFSPGTVLVERYRIVALLGRGGMGEVYRAEDLKLGIVVALKFLPASLQHDAAALAGFHSEVRNARQVSHPNVCRVYDIGEVNGQHFLTMEYIDGEDLASLLRRIGRLPADKALETAHQICAGLAAAHDCELLHRDLKPANIMLDGRGRVRITDFGLALSHDDATGRSVPDADVTSANGPRKQSLLQSKVCSFWMNLHLNSRSRNRATSAPRICSPLAARLRFTNGER